MSIYDFYSGLEARGFGPLNGKECDRGGCHTLDEKHYILTTDGLVIYSTHRDWDNPISHTREWPWDEFDFSELDATMEVMWSVD